MCGIIGYIGKRNASPIILDGLRHLEYRGYDSVGVVFVSPENLVVKKDVGRIEEVHSRLIFLEPAVHLAVGHCLHPETYVQLADGSIRKIEKVNPSAEVISLDCEKLSLVREPALAFKHVSPPFLYKIRTASTFLIATENHKMLVIEEGEVKEKRVAELSKKDLLILPRKVKVNGKPQRLNEIKIKRYYKVTNQGNKLIKEKIRAANKSDILKKVGLSYSYLYHILANDRNIREDKLCALLHYLKIPLSKKYFIPVNSLHGKFITLPKTTSPKLMQILGYLLGDGHVGKKYIRCKDNNKEVLEVYKNLFNEVFRLNGKIRKLRKYNAFLLELNSFYLCEWLRENFLNESDEFISSIGKLPNNQISSFLRGLFDAEGSVGLKSKQVCLRMNSEHLMRVVQFLLLRFGVVASFSKVAKRNVKWKDTWCISLSNYEAVSSFKKKISFTSRAKIEKLNKIEKELIAGHSYLRKTFPFLGKKLYKFLSKCGIKTKIYGDGYPLRSSLEKIKALLEEKLQFSTDTNLTELYTLLNKFLNSEILFERIQDIEKIASDTEFVYDLEVKNTENFIANCVISHNSRWATHGKVSKENAHPHVDCKSIIAIVHNGIIENYQDLRKRLASSGHIFRSETDSEVIAHLIEEEMKNSKSFEEACCNAFNQLEGTFAILAVKKGENKIVAAKKGSPLVIGIGEDEFFAASDIPAFIEHTKQVVYLYDWDMVVLDSKPTFFNIQGGKLTEVERPIHGVDWDAEKAKKGEFEHFMLKEICEQVETVQKAAAQDKEIVEKIAEEINRAYGIFFVGCGSSYHACLAASYIFSKVAKKHVNAILASEFPNYEHFLTKDTLVIAVSQSGETYDVLEAVRAAKKRGSKVISIVNVIGSSLTRESDSFLLMHTGPEICVLSTKTYTSQIALLTLLAYALIGKYGDAKKRLKYLWNVIYYLTSATTRNKIKELAEKLKDKEHIFCIGRGLQYPTALEAALKIKEVSYIHAEAFAGGELKHGTIALIEAGTPCIVFVSEENEREILSNAMEIKSRGGYIIGVSPKNNEIFDFWIKVPEVGTENPIVQIIPIQILAYQLALLRGCDPDHPRNLAKAVVVK